MFATYHNAGVRVFDLRDAYQPREVGVVHSADAGAHRGYPPRRGTGDAIDGCVRCGRRHDVCDGHEWGTVDPGVQG